MTTQSSRHTFTGFRYSGVDIFFDISGFVMALTTAEQPAWARGAVRFIVIRCVGIYIGWWPVILLYLLLYDTTSQLRSENLSGSFWLYQLNFTVLLFPVTWTLTYEFYLYAIVALSLLIPSGGRLIVYWVVLRQLWQSKGSGSEMDAIASRGSSAPTF